MQKENYNAWNQLVYYVSDVYTATKRFRAGRSGNLGREIRRTAISLSVKMNNLPQFNTPSDEKSKADMSKVYPILSSISVLETYLQLAKKYNFLKDTSVLDEKLKEVKDQLYRLLGE